MTKYQRYKASRVAYMKQRRAEGVLQCHRADLQPMRSYREVAAMMGISHQAVAQIEQRAIQKIRKEMAPYINEIKAL